MNPATIARQIRNAGQGRKSKTLLELGSLRRVDQLLGLQSIPIFLKFLGWVLLVRIERNFSSQVIKREEESGGPRLEQELLVLGATSQCHLL